MGYALDHIFICCSVDAPEAESLRRLGLTEGSSNTHPGQGTANRRFFFHNAYLELFWVSLPEEAQREPARSLRLWERWSGRDRSSCPFAIIVRSADDPDPGPPFQTWSYRPGYFPPGVSIEVAAGTSLVEPELFYMRGNKRPDQMGREPHTHASGMQEITRVRIEMPTAASISPAVRAAVASGVIEVVAGGKFVLHLELDHVAQGQSADLRPVLPMTLAW